jgi:DNA-binding transcriptional MocR family regulator
MIPEALADAAGRHHAKAVYLIPTMHNPTTLTIGPARREQLAATIRRCGLLLFEDDAYGSLDPKMQPIAALVPERSYLTVSLSKCIAPGLRVSFVLAPDRAAAAALANALRTVAQMPVPLMVALVMRWLADGSADAIISAVAVEAAARQRLAAKALAGYNYRAHPKGLHVWLALPSAWTRAEFAAHIQRQGLAVVTSDSFSVDDHPEHAIRIALGAARSRSDLVVALDLLTTALRSPTYASRIV